MSRSHETRSYLRALARRQVLDALAASSYRDCGLSHGWRAEGPGPARFGWWALHPCSATYLGRTADAACQWIAEQTESESYDDWLSAQGSHVDPSDVAGGAS